MIASTVRQTIQNIIEYWSKETEKGDKRTITMTQDKTNRADTDGTGEEKTSRGHNHRCDLPLVLTEEDGVAPLPVVGLPFELNRGFFGMFASPASLITILA